MKYKVGDKVRVREDLVMGGNYGGSVAVDDMTDMCGNVVTIERVGEAFGYYIEEDPDDYCWTDEMFEPVEEMSAVEALKIAAELCEEEMMCSKECPIKNIDNTIDCNTIKKRHPEEVVRVLEQWKADHKKKTIETERDDESIWEYLERHRQPNKALVRDNLRNVERMGFQVANEVK